MRTAIVAAVAAVALVLTPGAAVSAAQAAVHTATAPAPVRYPFQVPGFDRLTVNAAGTTAYLLDGYEPPPGRAVMRVIDLPTRRVVADVPLGEYASKVVLDEPRHRAYITHQGSRSGTGGSVWVVSLTTNRVVRVWPVDSPGEPVLSPDGRSLWVMAQLSRGTTGAVLVLDPTTGRITTTIRLAGRFPTSPVFTPDGRKLYVQNAVFDGLTPATVSVIDTATRTVVATVPDPPFLDAPRLVMDPTGSRVLVTDPFTPLGIIDTATDRLVDPVPELVGTFVFDAAGHLIQVRTPSIDDIDGTFRVRDATTFVPVSPLQDYPGNVEEVASAANGLLVLLTNTRPRLTGNTSFPSLTVVDPLQSITASTLPREVVLAGPSTTVPFTVSQSRPKSPTTVALDSAVGGRRLGASVVTPDGNGRLSGSVTFPAGDSDIGSRIWTLSAGTASTVGVQSTYLRARSLLGMAVTRRGDLVDVIGAAKAWTSAGNTYVPTAGRGLVLQRYTSTGWRKEYSLTTDRFGHVATTRRIPFRVALRLVAVGTQTASAVTSNQVVR